MKTKLALIINLIFFVPITQVSASAICRSDISFTLWPNDQINEQYECENENTTLCVTKAIWANDNSEYITIKSTRGELDKYALVNSTVWTVDDEVGVVSETETALQLFSEPKPAFLIDEIKLRHEFKLNKATGLATYILAEKKVSVFSFLKEWEISISENLRCRRKVQPTNGDSL